MGKIRKGVLGGFSGTVGTVVGGNWNGIQYMRSLPDVRKTTNSVAVEVQKAKFTLAANFLRPLGCPTPELLQTFLAVHRQRLSLRTQSPKTAASEAGSDRAEHPEPCGG